MLRAVGPATDYISSNFGVHSSCCFPFRARTDRQTLTDQQKHSMAMTGVGTYIHNTIIQNECTKAVIWTHRLLTKRLTTTLDNIPRVAVKGRSCSLQLCIIQRGLQCLLQCVCVSVVTVPKFLLTAGYGIWQLWGGPRFQIRFRLSG